MENLENNNQLDSFDFDVDDGVQGVSMTGNNAMVLDDSFGNPEPEKMNESQKPETEQKPDEQQPQQRQRKSSNEVDLGDDSEFELPSGEEEEPVPNNNGNDDYFSRLATEFKTQGFISGEIEVPTDHNLTEEEFRNIMIQTRLNDAIDIYKKEFADKFENDPEAMAFLQYKLKGGKTRDFIETYGKINEFEDIDLSSSANQDFVLRNYYSQLGFSNQQIEDQLEMLEDKGKKEEYARQGLEKLNENNKKEKEKLEEKLRTEQQMKQQEEINKRKFFAAALNNTDDINGIKLDKDNKQNLYSLLTGNIKLQDGSLVNAMNYKLKQVLEDPQKAVVFAYMLHNNFDLSSFARSIETQKTKEISRNLINNKSGRTTPNQQKRSSNDWF